MVKNIFAALSFVSVALAFGACSSSSSGSGGGAETCNTITHDSKFATEKCNNASDRCYLQTNQPTVRHEAGACATSAACLAFISTPDDPAAVKCVTDCLTPKLNNALSVACEECSQKVAACGARNCAAQCVSAPDSAECTTCLCTTHSGELGGKGGNCLQDVFGDCAGFRPTDAQVGCGATGGKDGG